MVSGIWFIAARFASWFLVVLAASFGTIVLNSEAAYAASSTIQIPGGGQLIVNANNAFRDYELGITELSGDVQLFFKEQYISCDHAVVYEKTHIVEAKGNLVISSPTVYVEGDRAVLNYSDNTGVIENGFIKSGQVIFQGKVVRKLGPDAYQAEYSSYTACTTCPTAWTFTGTRMHAEIGGYAYIKNPIMRIANVPVLWLPYLVIPLKSERQTGFLIPSLEYSGEDGFVLGLKFFWAIDRSQDILFTLKNYTRRGFKLLGDYSYMLSHDSYGNLNFGVMNDHMFSIDPNSGGESRRWFLTYEHHYELPEGFSQKAKANLVSDIWYPRDFWLEMPGRGDPALENRVSLTHNTDSSHASAEIDYYINMLQSQPIASDSATVHRWPELRYSLVDRPLFPGSRILGGLNVNYVNFGRDDFGFDDVAFDGNRKFIDRKREKSGINPINGTPYAPGRFDPETDIVRSGQRLDIRPEISRPFMLGSYVDVLPALQFRHTQYAFSLPVTDPSYDANPSRSYALARMSARMRFFRVYGREESKAPEQALSPDVLTNWTSEEGFVPVPPAPPQQNPIYRHEIMPEIVATYLPYISQPADHPFFAQGGLEPIFLEDVPISDNDFRSEQSRIQFDYYDRLTTRTTVTLMVTNRLVRKRWIRGTPEYKQVASWRLSQGYDFDEASRTNEPRLPFGDIQSLLDIHLDQFDLNSRIRYFPYHGVTNSSSYVRIRSLDNRQFFQTQFSQSWAITRRPEETTKNPDSVTFTAGFATRYIDLGGRLTYMLEGPDPLFRVNSWAAELNLKPPGDCWGIRVHYEQTFNGPTAIKLDFDYNFGGA